MDASEDISGSDADASLAPIVGLTSSQLLVVSNLLRRSAALRYHRMLGLTSIEFGILAMLGRRAPMPLNRLAELMGIDKAQASRALTRVVAQGFVARQTNPRDNREVLIRLSAAGLAAHDAMVEVGRTRNAHLVADLSAAELRQLESMLARLTARAADLLRIEQESPAQHPAPDL